MSLSSATSNDFTDRLNQVDIAPDAVAFSPSAKPTASYVVHGDSYQAGQGVQPYYANSDVGGGAPHTDDCHRSPQAYPASPSPTWQPSTPVLLSPTSWPAAAPSSATSPETRREAGRFRRRRPAGWMTTPRWSRRHRRALRCDRQGCLLTLTACTDPNYHLTVAGTVDPQPLVTYEPSIIDGLALFLPGAYTAIKNAAPLAKLIVLGYPHIVAQGARRGGVDCGLFGQPTVDFFQQMTDRLNGVIARSAASAGVRYVSPVATFQGPPDHSACTANIANEWINAVVAFSSSGSGSSLPDAGVGSFHPDANGHAAEAAMLKPSLP